MGGPRGRNFIEHQTTSEEIPVPSPYGLDLTLDGSTLIVGTHTNQFYSIDTTQLNVISRTTVPKGIVGTSQTYIELQWPAVTANSSILFVGGASGSLVSVFQWNPKTQSLTPRSDANVGNTSRVSRSADGSKLLFWDSNGGGVSLYSSATDTFVEVKAAESGNTHVAFHSRWGCESRRNANYHCARIWRHSGLRRKWKCRV